MPDQCALVRGPSCIAPSVTEAQPIKSSKWETTKYRNDIRLTVVEIILLELYALLTPNLGHYPSLTWSSSGQALRLDNRYLKPRYLTTTLPPAALLPSSFAASKASTWLLHSPPPPPDTFDPLVDTVPVRPAPPQRPLPKAPCPYIPQIQTPSPRPMRLIVEADKSFNVIRWSIGDTPLPPWHKRLSLLI
eukprot:g14412.t1